MKKPRLQTLMPRLQQLAGSRVQTLNPGSWRTSDMSSAARGYGYKWQKARERFLIANPPCCYCEREGKVTAATVVDHIEPHRGDQGLFWNENNWQSLCQMHHNGEKQREESMVGGG